MRTRWFGGGGCDSQLNRRRPAVILHASAIRLVDTAANSNNRAIRTRALLRTCIHTGEAARSAERSCMERAVAAAAAADSADSPQPTHSAAAAVAVVPTPAIPSCTHRYSTRTRALAPLRLRLRLPLDTARRQPLPPRRSASIAACSWTRAMHPENGTQLHSRFSHVNAAVGLSLTLASHCCIDRSPPVVV